MQKRRGKAWEKESRARRQVDMRVDMRVDTRGAVPDCDQKLEVGTAWERGYTQTHLIFQLCRCASVIARTKVHTHTNKRTIMHTNIHAQTHQKPDNAAGMYQLRIVFTPVNSAGIHY